MKVKVKLDVASIKAWLLEHGEKPAFGLMVLVFLLFTYSAARRDVLDDSKQPDKLQAKADEVKRHVDDSKWDEQREGVQVVDYRKRVAREPVDTAAFALRIPFNSPLADPKSKREVPKLFNAEELKVASGFGVFAFSGEAADPAAAKAPAQAGKPKEAQPWKPRANAAQNQRPTGSGYKPKSTAKLKGQPWAVITGLVPIEKQRQEYARAFEHGMGADRERDTPHYEYDAKVQRAEIDDAHPEQLNWKDLPKSNVDDNERAWEGDVAEIVASACVDPVLTGSLGPLVDVAWGESIAHPKVPLASAGDDQPRQPAQPKVEQEAAPDPAQAKADDNGFTRPKRVAPVIPPPGADAPGQGAPEIAKYRLLRVFDYSVEPNKKYRYRLMLAAANPNYNVSPQYLQNPESAKSEVIKTEDWTAPTDAVTIPNGYGVLAGGIEPKSGEPTAKLMLTAIDKQEGIEAATEIKVQRGSVANITKGVVAVDPRNGETKDMSDVEFKTDMVVLDIYGGKLLSKKNGINAPIEVLLLDAHGNLWVHNELDDHVEYEHRKPPAESAARPAPTIPGDGPKGSKPLPIPKPRSRR
jgi:hypothetical protein